MGQNRKLSSIGWAFCFFFAVFLGQGCRGRTAPAFLQDRPSPAWRSNQEERWSRALAKAPSDSVQWPAAIRSTTVAGDRILWVSEAEGATELWSATLNAPLSSNAKPKSEPLAQKHLVLRREYPDVILSAALSPDGQRALLQSQNSATAHPETRCRLELVELETPSKAQTLSSDASLYLLPAWCADDAFLWAEMGDQIATVYRQTSTGERRTVLTHHWPYARLLLQQLEPTGWMVVDRNDPMSTHCWITPLADPTGPWQEIEAKGQRARPMGWYKDRLLVVSRSGTDKSEVLLVPPKLDDKGQTVLDWSSAKTVLSTIPIENGFFSGDRLLFLGPGAWGQQMRSLDLKTAKVEEIPVDVDPFRAGAFHPLSGGRAVLSIQGPFQPPACYLVDANPPSLRPLLKPEQSAVRREDFRVTVDEHLVRIAPLVSSAPPVPHPILLESYGAFGETLPAAYDPLRLQWLRLGGELAIAPLRGTPRHHDLVVDQLLRIAQSLAPSPVVYRGQSFGGTLGLMAMQQKGEVFAAVYADAPLTDLVRFPDYPPGELWIPELGDPKDPTDRERLLGLSPLENLRATNYPPVVISTSLSDPVVDRYHALSFVERAQSVNPDSVTLFQEQKSGIHERLKPNDTDQASMARVLWSLARAGSRMSSGKNDR